MKKTNINRNSTSEHVIFLESNFFRGYEENFLDYNRTFIIRIE